MIILTCRVLLPGCIYRSEKTLQKTLEGCHHLDRKKIKRTDYWRFIFFVLSESQFMHVTLCNILQNMSYL